jgi:arginine utilization protein RocB
VNAAYVMAELIREIELSEALLERTGNEVAAPPATLHGKDLKQGYNVTTPAHAFAYWNTMQHQRSGSEVVRIAMALAAKAVARAESKTGHKIVLTTFAALGLGAKAKPNPAFSLPEQSLQAMMEIAPAIDTPTVVLGFGSIPYPAVLLRDQALRKTISDAVRTHGLAEVNYFAGISDMSFFGETSGDLSVVQANTPIWGTGFTMPEAAGYPCINIGPWGRDYHTWLERVHASYAFETLPRVLLSVIDAVARSG